MLHYYTQERKVTYLHYYIQEKMKRKEVEGEL